MVTRHAPGELMHKEPIDTDINGARAWRIHYATKDVNDVVHEASGLVIAPDGKGENRPLLTWCHGTTGLGDAACPSARPDPARELITYFDPKSTQQIDFGVPGLQAMIDAGWVVCSTDTIARKFRLKGAALKSDSSNFDDWEKAIDAGSAAQHKPVAPVLVCIDGFDGGTVVRVSWQDAYIDAVKKLGGQVDVKTYPKADHFALPRACLGDALAWLNAKRK